MKITLIEGTDARQQICTFWEVRGSIWEIVIAPYEIDSYNKISLATFFVPKCQGSTCALIWKELEENNSLIFFAVQLLLNGVR